VHYNGAKPQNDVVQKFCTKGGQSLLFLAQWKKTFFSTSNVVISQSMRSIVAKLFAHVLLVVQGKILRSKVKKSEKNFICASWAKNGRFGAFLEKNSLGPLGVRACFHCSDFQSKNFSYVISIVKKRPLYVNFSIPPLWKLMLFSRFHTPCGNEILWTCT
jgi:hypothetical protein